MDGNLIKVTDECNTIRKNKDVHRVLIQTMDSDLMERWKKAREIGRVFSDWVKKQWVVIENGETKKRIVYGRISFNGWRLTRSNTVNLSKEKVLQIWVSKKSPLLLGVITHKHIGKKLCPTCWRRYIENCKRINK